MNEYNSILIQKTIYDSIAIMFFIAIAIGLFYGEDTIKSINFLVDQNI
ncbi:hypothetical protein [Romboutsia lituseburensis]|nr:hypothetical protein [Romboutsia lituseburensis]MCR8746827.1 hypothetical protein [Romboutsia lituseburensis]